MAFTSWIRRLAPRLFPSDGAQDASTHHHDPMPAQPEYPTQVRRGFVKQACWAGAGAVAVAVSGHYSEKLLPSILPSFEDVECKVSKIKSVVWQALPFDSTQPPNTQFTIVLARLNRDVDGTYTEDLVMLLAIYQESL
jgi:hypothetical protein